MPAKSKAQQKFMGMVHGLQKGTVKPSSVSGKVKKVAKDMPKKDAEDFASTKHKGKPEHVKESLRRIIRREVRSVMREARTINVEPNWEGVYRFMMHLKKGDNMAFTRITRKMGSDWKKLAAMAEKNKWITEAVNLKDMAGYYTDAMKSLDKYFLNLAAIPAPKKAKKVSKLMTALQKSFFSKNESIREGFSPSLVRRAMDIAKKMSGNMTGATDKIEKIKKGLSKDKKVADALRLANESVNEAFIKKSKLIKERKMATKLKDLLVEVFQEGRPVNKHAVIEGVSQYGAIGKPLYGSNIVEIAQQLVNIAESAQNHILSETDEWFDKVSVNRNMKSLKGMVKEFKTAATEYNSLNQRLTALYEDMGSILNRYYDIHEALDTPGEEDSDIDNDGDTDASDDYLKKKRAAITKAVAKQ